MSLLGDELGCALDILKVNIGSSGEADNNALCARDRSLKQRAGNGALCRLCSLVLAGGLGKTHVSIACVLHYRSDIGEVEVDEAGDFYKLGDTLDAVEQDLIRHLKSLGK